MAENLPIEIIERIVSLVPYTGTDNLYYVRYSRFIKNGKQMFNIFCI